jgi:6-phosphogluconolactonase
MGHRRWMGGVAAAGMALTIALPGVASAHERASGFVYTQTNAPSGNAVLAFARGGNGQLRPIGTFLTGGTGTGASLGSQGAVALSDDGRWLLAVDAGSSDIALFRVREDGRLSLADRDPSGGLKPVSVTEHDGLVYVLDAGGSGNIAGFRIGGERLRMIQGSSQPLSGSATGAAEVAFSSDGRDLVVTEKATNSIDTYRVGRDGRAGSPTTTASAGAVPYGFAFDNRNHAIVSEAANSTVSSYRVGRHGTSVVTASVATGQEAACWVAVSVDGRWAFDANAHTNTISSFSIAPDGSLTLAHAVAASTGAGTTPLDLATTADGHLFALEAGVPGIAGYAMGPGGSLPVLGTTVSVPAGSTGLAAS